jgi:antitoxin component YwqK of YwqJK toxin-antitoxin module
VVVGTLKAMKPTLIALLALCLCLAGCKKRFGKQVDWNDLEEKTVTIERRSKYDYDTPNGLPKVAPPGQEWIWNENVTFWILKGQMGKFSGRATKYTSDGKVEKDALFREGIPFFEENSNYFKNGELKELERIFNGSKIYAKGNFANGKDRYELRLIKDGKSHEDDVVQFDFWHSNGEKLGSCMIPKNQLSKKLGDIKPDNGVYVEYHDDASIKSLRRFRNGKKDGPSWELYPNGKTNRHSIFREDRETLRNEWDIAGKAKGQWFEHSLTNSVLYDINHDEGTEVRYYETWEETKDSSKGWKGEKLVKTKDVITQYDHRGIRFYWRKTHSPTGVQETRSSWTNSIARLGDVSTTGKLKIRRYIPRQWVMRQGGLSLKRQAWDEHFIPVEMPGFSLNGSPIPKKQMDARSRLSIKVAKGYIGKSKRMIIQELGPGYQNTGRLVFFKVKEQLDPSDGAKYNRLLFIFDVVRLLDCKSFYERQDQDSKTLTVNEVLIDWKFPGKKPASQLPATGGFPSPSNPAAGLGFPVSGIPSKLDPVASYFEKTQNEERPVPYFNGTPFTGKAIGYSRSNGFIVRFFELNQNQTSNFKRFVELNFVNGKPHGLFTRISDKITEVTYSNGQFDNIRHIE